MQIDRIKGCNMMLQAPSEPDEDGLIHIEQLPVIANQDGYVSQWRPSPEELEMLNAGAPIRLHVYAQWHPAVRVDIGQIEKLDG